MRDARNEGIAPRAEERKPILYDDKIVQNHGTDLLHTITSRSVEKRGMRVKRQDKKGEEVLCLQSQENADGEYLLLKAYQELEAYNRVTTMKLWDMFTIALYHTKVDKKRDWTGKTVYITIEEYMNLRGVTDRKRALEVAKEDGEILVATYLNFCVGRKGCTKGKNKRRTVFCNICQKFEIVNGIMYLQYTDDMYTALTRREKETDNSTAFVMPFPKEAFKLPDKGSSYMMFSKLLYQKNLNHDTISVDILLKYCPELPTIEEARKGGKCRISQQIKSPFEQDLNTLVDRGFITWEYDAPGIECPSALPYDEWVKLKLKITWFDYPERKKKPGKENAAIPSQTESTVSETVTVTV